jgi:hypothetical protein
MKMTLANFIADGSIVPVTVTNPGTKEITRALNAMIKDLPDGRKAIVLSETTKQFQLWRFNLGKSSIVYDGNNHYKVEEVSFFSRPKFPILTCTVAQPEMTDEELTTETEIFGRYKLFGVA